MGSFGDTQTDRQAYSRVRIYGQESEQVAVALLGL